MTCDYLFKKGEVVTITGLYEDGNPPYYEATNGIESWFIDEGDVELV